MGRAADRAFPQEGILLIQRQGLAEEAQRGADVIGAIPHFEFTREYGVESLHYIFVLAEKYPVLVDVPWTRSMTSSLALSRPWQPWLTSAAWAIGDRHHTTAMHSYNGAYASRLFRLLKHGRHQLRRESVGDIHLRDVRYLSQARALPGEGDLEANINVCFGTRCVRSLVSHGHRPPQHAAGAHMGLHVARSWVMSRSRRV